jgi:type IV pilus assembly protein PilM
MSFFDSIAKFFSNEKVTKVLGVDIGSSSIKVVQLSLKKGIAVLDTFGEISLSVYGDKRIGLPVSLPKEKVTEALEDLMKEAQVDATIAAFAIPLKSTLMFNLKLPKNLKKDELDKIVRVESRKYIPVPISEVQLDWSVLPELRGKIDEENYDILVVAIHKETLNKYSDIAVAARLNLKFLEVETFSTIRSVIRHERNTTAIIDIGSSITKFYIVESGIVRESNIINIGSSKMLSEFRGKENKTSLSGEVNGSAARLLRETMIEGKNIPIDLIRIISQVKKAIIQYQKKNNKDIPEVVVTGGGSLLKNLIPYVKKELAAEIIEADPFSKVSNPVFLDGPLKEAGPEFSVAVGGALRGLKN